MGLPLRLVLGGVFFVAAVVLAVTAVRRNGLTGGSSSIRERVLIYTPLSLCVFACGMSLLGAW